MLNNHIEHLKALNWLVSMQNIDGSWGKSDIEKIRWTSNAIIVFQDFGFNKEYYPVKKGIKWLLKYPDSKPEWFLKLPPLLAYGFKESVLTNGDLTKLQSLFETDTLGILPIKVAIALELKEYGVTINNVDRLEKSIMNTIRDEENGFISFSSSTNDTSLYCEFLATFFPGKYDDNIKKCLDWVILRKIQNLKSKSICWEDSYGITVYVTLNLMSFADKKELISSYISSIFNYFKVTDEGSIPPDKVPAHESKSSIYTTILYLRLCSKVANSNLITYKNLFVNNFIQRRMILFKLKRYKKVLKLMTTSFVIFLSIALFMYYVLGKEFFVSALASLVASLIPYLFLFIKKNT